MKEGRRGKRKAECEMRNLEREELSHHEGHEVFSRRGAENSGKIGMKDGFQTEDSGLKTLDRRLWTED